MIQRLKDLNISPTEAANRMGGVAKSFVRDITKGRKRSVRGDNLTKLADVLLVTESWLSGREENGHGAGRVDTPTNLIEIPMRGVVAAGAWVAEEEAPSLTRESREMWPIAPLQGYSPASLFALRIGERGANLGYERGTVLIVAPAAAGDLYADDHAIILTRRGGLVETVVRQVVLVGDRWALADTVADPQLRDAWPVEGGKTPAHEVLGVVIGHQMIRQRRAKIHPG